jgi:hypothetical protein
MFGRRRPKPKPLNPGAAEIRFARRELRCIERELTQFHHRTDIHRLRQLTQAHAAWREHLAQHGVNHPAPLIHW